MSFLRSIRPCGRLRTQTQPATKPRRCLAPFVQFQFFMGCFRVHLFTLRNGQCLQLKGRPRHLAEAHPRRYSRSPHKPSLQNPDASETSLIQKLPISYQIRRAFEWKGLFEGLHDIDEHLPIFRIFSPVPGQMNINASPAELRVEVSERKQFVGPKQNVHSLRLVGDGLDHVQLIEQAAARWNLAEMLGLIDHHRQRLAIPDGLLYGKTVFSANCPRRWHEPHDRTSVSIQFVVDQRLVKLAEKAFVVIAPIKTS
jgi:hypothetical protein